MSGLDYINRIIAAVGEKKVLRNEEMSRHTTFRIGGPADCLVQPENAEELREILRICREEEAKIKKFDYPEMKIEKVFKRLFEQKGVKMDTKSIVLVAQFFRITSTKYVRLYDETISVLEELKAKGKKIYLLSNAQNAFTAYEMKYLGIYDYFDGIKISSNESVRKPSLMFYDSLFEQYGLKKEESVMIGNDWISDMKSANDYGIDSIYIHTDISPRDTIIEEIRATYKILDGNIGNVKKYIR